MDTSSGAWLEGYRRIYLVLILDDFSRTILAARFFNSDSTYNYMLVLREAIEGYGIFPILYSDNEALCALLENNKAGLSSLFITSQTEISKKLPEGISKATALPLWIDIRKADGNKCARCWNWSGTVGKMKDFSDICARCADAVRP